MQNQSLSRISRRSVFKWLGIGSTAFALDAPFSKPQPTIIEQDLLKLPRHLQKPKSVVVVGAGLAGLACAYELTQRGFQVTLLEQAQQLGGKLASWQIKAVGETFVVEHGFHGFFPQYYNLNDLVKELGIAEHFLSLKTYSMLYQDKRYQPEVFRSSSAGFPWNLVDLALSSPNMLRWGLNLTSIDHWHLFRAITGFAVTDSYTQLDNLSVADWVAKNFPKGLHDLYFLPFAKSSLNAVDEFSVAEMLQFFHFYFFGNPEGLAFKGTRQDMVTSLIRPIADAIEKHGGHILTGVNITSIQAQTDRISGISYQKGQGQPLLWVERQAGEIYGAGDESFAIQSGEEEAVSLRCTHQGCLVKPEADGRYRCPCHGSRFDKQGKVLQGPAQQDLARVQVVASDGVRFQLAGAGGTVENLTADYYVLAADIPGIQRIFQSVQGEMPPSVIAQIGSLRVADPFAVLRLWFDKDFAWEHSDFTSISGYRLVDSITLYHRIQEDYIDWAKRTGGSVVELHAYGYKEKDFPDQETIIKTFLEELFEIVPTLKEAKLLHQSLVNQKNFAGFPPGSDALRPRTLSAIPNLLFAGDWVKMPFPCGLMERATSSGFLAANAILKAQGLQRRILYSVNPEGALHSMGKWLP
jgi:carotenoid phi-ring synthase / carotenoid chi-ring synthase